MNPTTEIDLGTPASSSAQTVRIEIDGLPTTVNAGSTIMLRRSGIGYRHTQAVCHRQP